MQNQKIVRHLPSAASPRTPEAAMNEQDETQRGEKCGKVRQYEANYTNGASSVVKYVQNNYMHADPNFDWMRL